MRVVFSVVALLVVAFIVMQLASRQLKAVVPPAPSADGSVTPRPQAQQVGDQFKQALEQGAAARASEAGQ